MNLNIPVHIFIQIQNNYVAETKTSTITILSCYNVYHIIQYLQEDIVCYKFIITPTSWNTPLIRLSENVYFLRDWFSVWYKQIGKYGNPLGILQGFFEIIH